MDTPHRSIPRRLRMNSILVQLQVSLRSGSAKRSAGGGQGGAASLMSTTQTSGSDCGYTTRLANGAGCCAPLSRPQSGRSCAACSMNTAKIGRDTICAPRPRSNGSLPAKSRCGDELRTRIAPPRDRRAPRRARSAAVALHVHEPCAGVY